MRSLLFFLSVLCLLASCRKPNEPAPKPKTTEELLQGSWRVTELYVMEQPGMQVHNEIDDMLACEKDNFLLFMDNRVIYNYGELKCSTEPQTDSTTTWQVSDKTIYFYSPIDTVSYLIQELSETTLKMQYSQEQMGGTGIAYFTYTRI